METLSELEDPFISSLDSIFSNMVQCHITKGEKYNKEQNTTLGDTSALIDMSGTYNGRDFSGKFLISFPLDTYLKCAGAMMFEEFTEIDDENSDVGAEICNMVVGNAKGELEKLGFKLSMATPEIIQGKNVTIEKISDDYITTVVPVSCEHGDFFIELSTK